jgi:hypothetical protein
MPGCPSSLPRRRLALLLALLLTEPGSGGEGRHIAKPEGKKSIYILFITRSL